MKIDITVRCSCGEVFNFTGDNTTGQQYLAEFVDRHIEHTLEFDVKQIEDGLPTWPRPPWPNENKSSCPKCGLELSDVMMYYCPQPDCPTGLGGVRC